MHGLLPGPADGTWPPPSPPLLLLLLLLLPLCACMPCLLLVGTRARASAPLRASNGLLHRPGVGAWLCRQAASRPSALLSLPCSRAPAWVLVTGRLHGIQARRLFRYSPPDHDGTRARRRYLGYGPRPRHPRHFSPAFIVCPGRAVCQQTMLLAPGGVSTPKSSCREVVDDAS